jgi:hypothetical protein
MYVFLNKLLTIYKKTNEENSIVYTQAEIRVWKVREMPDDRLCFIYAYVHISQTSTIRTINRIPSTGCSYMFSERTPTR